MRSLEQLTTEITERLLTELPGSFTTTLVEDTLPYVKKSTFPGLIVLVAKAANPETEDARLDFLISYFFFSSRATAVFDDLIDQDKSYALHQKIGQGKALLVALGNWFVAERELLKLIAKSPFADEGILLVENIYQTYLQALVGQFAEVEELKSDFLTVERCLQLAAYKSGLFLQLLFGAAATCAGADRAIIQKYSAVGYKLGVLRQLANDYASCFASDPARNSLQQKLFTLPLAYALTGQNELTQQIRKLWATEELSPDQLVELRKLITHSGSFFSAQLSMCQIYQQIEQLLLPANEYDQKILEVAKGFLIQH